MIPISRPSIDERAEKLVLEVLRSGHLARGPMTEELERRFCEVAESKHAIAVSSGTSALELAIEATIDPGDVVITTPFTFAATMNAALRAGAVIRFVDIGDDFNIDPTLVASVMDESVRVILPVHLYGRPCDMIAITDTATRWEATVIEDAAQAVGAYVEGRKIGSWGLGCFSLYATKNVTAGEGGVITTNDSELAERLRMLSNQGMNAPYEYAMAGTNRRITDVQAAIALPQLEDLASLTAARRHNALRLSEILGEVPGLVTPVDHPGHVYHQYTIRITADARLNREELRECLTRAHIATGVYYPRVVFDYESFRSHPGIEDCHVPRSKAAASEVLSLPVFPGLTGQEIDRVGNVIAEALDA